jgi:hypothetical protein
LPCSYANWNLPPKFVNETWQASVVTGGYGYGGGTLTYSYYGSVNYTNDPNLLKRLTNECWYVNGQGGKVSVGGRLYFANGDNVTFAAFGHISIYRPSVNPIVKHTPYGAGTSGNMLSLENGPMYFDVTINSQYPGSFGLTQLVNCSSESDFLVYDSTYGSYYLDGQEYYSTAAQDGVCKMSDAPGVILIYQIASYKGAWKAYVRFTPEGGIPVTLGRIDWNWAASCMGVPFWWHIVSDDVVGPTFNADDAFAIWTNVKHPNAK